jgi:hypothetical protein
MFLVGLSDWSGPMLDVLLKRRARLFGVALKAAAKGIRDAARRANERYELSELSSLERRDLGSHQVDQELKKWPWQG